MKLLFTAAFFLITSIAIFAQPKRSNAVKKTVATTKTPVIKKTHKVVQITGDCLCTIMGPKLDSISPVVYQYLEDSGNLGDKIANQKLTKAVSKLNEEDGNALIKEMEGLEAKLNFDEAIIESCVTDKVASLTEAELAYQPAESQMDKEILRYLQTLPTCKRLAFILKMEAIDKAKNAKKKK